MRVSKRGHGRRLRRRAGKREGAPSIPEFSGWLPDVAGHRANPQRGAAVPLSDFLQHRNLSRERERTEPALSMMRGALLCARSKGASPQGRRLEPSADCDVDHCRTRHSRVILRPWRLPEALWAVAGAIALVAFGLLPVPDALDRRRQGRRRLSLPDRHDAARRARAQRRPVRLARRRSPRACASGSPTRLFALVYVVGIVVTAFLRTTRPRSC